MNENKDKNKKYTEFQKRMSGGRHVSIWQIIFFFLLFWLIFDYVNQSYLSNDSVNISYSEFLKQLNEDNISEVTFKGDQLIGSFKSAYLSQTKNDSSLYSYFSTTKPNASQEFVNQLENKNVTIRAEQENGWFNIFLISVLPWVLIFAVFYFISRRMRGQAGKMMNSGFFNIGKSKAKRFTRSEEDTRFSDVAGLENAKKDLEEIVQYLKTPVKFARLGARIPKGVLLVGAPGTGKTLLARATAGEAGVSFFSISGSEFIEMFVGVGASRVRDMFATAKKESPSIVFIDEIDSVGRSRGTGLGGGHDEREQTLNQILSEMDGFEDKHSVVVIAATNRPDVLDPALTRPGRFDRQIMLNLPHKNARHEILKIHTRHVPLDEQVDLHNIAARTVSFSGADLKNLVNEAALLAGRREKSTVDSADFDAARDKILLGGEREFMISDAEKKVIAYHEAGHALIAKLLPDADPLQKVTIIPHGKALGVTEQLPEKETFNLQRHYLLDRILVTLGGRSAEKIIFKEVSSGAANDLKLVTKIARQMVCHWGMSDRLGPVYYKNNESHPFLGKEITQGKDYSENTARKIDEEVQNIIENMENKAIELLEKNHNRLDKLAKNLLEEETLDTQQVDDILKIKKDELQEVV